ncbi:MAG: hypothetical protein AAFQ59_17950 [Pseudomonadota bacterium]
MTTIITRVFEEKQAAVDTAERLIFRGLPRRAITVIGPSEGNVSHDRMSAARVHPDAIDTYAQAITSGKSLLVVRATYKPLAAATMVREMLADRATVPIDGVINDYFVNDPPESTPKILDDHPLFLTMRPGAAGYKSRRIFEGLGLPLLSERKERDSARGKSGFRSAAFWPMPLLSTKERTSSVIKGGRHISPAFWLMPLLSTDKREKSVLKDGKPISRILGWPTSS